jgi:hypothetical protein
VKSSSLSAAAAFLCLLAVIGCSNKGSSANSATNSAATPPASATNGSTASASSAPAVLPPATIPAGAEIHVVLDTTVSSRDNQAGDTFEAALGEPIVVNGRVVLERHTRVRGVVVDARPSGRLSKPALLALALKSVQCNGAWVDIHTHDLTLEGKSHEKRDTVAIGGGSALGAIIGGIAGGGKGAAIGALAGGGAGTAGAAATGKKDITLPAESHVTFRLSRSATVQTQ